MENYIMQFERLIKKTKCHLLIETVKCAVYIGVMADSEGVLRTHSNILDGALCKNNLRV